MSHLHFKVLCRECRTLIAQCRCFDLSKIIRYELCENCKSTTGEKPMNHDENEVESMIQEKGLDAPRVKPEDLDNEILAEQYHVFPGTTTTVCLLTLRNGFSVNGWSTAASPENFDEEIGRKIARDNARQQIWPLLGFRLRDRLADVDFLGADVP